MAPNQLKQRWLGRSVAYTGVLTLYAVEDCRALADMLRARGAASVPVSDIELCGISFNVAITPCSAHELEISLPAFGPCATWPIAPHYVYDYLQGRGGVLTLDRPMPIVEVLVAKGRVRYELAQA
jgi:hypothetical protein